MTKLYNCKREIDAAGAQRFRITKFDGNMEVESSYLTDGASCECPAGERPTCRHRNMLPRFLARDAVNTFWFHDYERNGWVSMGLEQPVEFMPMPPLPAGVTMLDLSKTSPETLHNTIASAVGEPRAPRKINRRGF